MRSEYITRVPTMKDLKLLNERIAKLEKLKLQKCEIGFTLNMGGYQSVKLSSKEPSFDACVKDILKQLSEDFGATTVIYEKTYDFIQKTFYL